MKNLRSALAGTKNRTVAVIVALTFIAAIFGQVVLAGPSDHPIQDTYKAADTAVGGSLPNCPPVLDQPVSGKNVDGAITLRDPSDLDLDAIPNIVELAQGSDPTDPRSTPDDHDADGEPKATDPCDFDHRIPGANLVLTVTRFRTGAAPERVDAAVNGARRGDVLEFRVEVKNRNGVPIDVDADLVQVLFLIDSALEDFEPQADLTLARQSVGVFTGSLTLRADHRTANGAAPGDAAGWTIQATAAILAEPKFSDAKIVRVDPRTFDNVLSAVRCPSAACGAVTVPTANYFQGDIVEVRAAPPAGTSANQAAGVMTLKMFNGANQPVTVNPSGITDAEKQSKAMPWNATGARWEGQVTLTTAILNSNTDGIWRIEVSGRDGATVPNTAPLKTLSIFTNDRVRDLIQLSVTRLGDAPAGAPDPEALCADDLNPLGDANNCPANQVAASRRQSITAVATVFQDGVALTGATVALEFEKRDGGGGTKADVPMVETSPAGTYAATFAFDIGEEAGLWDLVATSGTLPASDLHVVDIFARTDLPLFVSTDQAEYVAPVPGSTTPDTITVIAVPMGVENVVFFNAAGGEPGTASFEIATGEGVPITLEPVPMPWVAANALYPQSHFEGAYGLEGKDFALAGAWTVTATFLDEAPGASNEGASSAGVNANEGLNGVSPLPPQIGITKINGELNAGLPIGLDVQAWTIEGLYREPPDNNAPFDEVGAVDHVWVRVGARPWRLADLDETTGTWSYLMNSQIAELIQQDGVYEIQAVAGYDPTCHSSDVDPEEFGCMFNDPADPEDTGLLNGPPFILHSATAIARVDLDFPDEAPTLTILGVRRVDTPLAAPAKGDVLTDGQSFVILGEVAKEGNVLPQLLLDINRVVFANCVDPDDAADINHDAAEWCRREALLPAVDLYEVAAGGVAGLSPANAVIDDTSDPEKITWEFTVDLSEAFYASPSLVRRTNTMFEVPAGGATTEGTDEGDSGASLGGRVKRPNVSTGTSELLPEILEDTGTTVWERQASAFGSTQMAAQGLDYVGKSNYWARSIVVTDGGFRFANSLPATHLDFCLPEPPVGPGGECEDGMGASGTILPAVVAAGTFPGTVTGDQGISLGFGAYPRASVTAIHNQFHDGEVIPVGDPDFRLHRDEGLRVDGTIENLGNDIAKVQMVIYSVSFSNCIDDNRQANAGSHGNDDDSEWCSRSTTAQVFELFPSPPGTVSVDFGGGAYDPAWDAAATQPVSALVPVTFTQSNHMVTFRLTTSDGDVIEELPLLAENQPIYSTMGRAINDDDNCCEFEEFNDNMYFLLRDFESPAPASIINGVLDVAGAFRGAYLTPRGPALLLDEISNITKPRMDETGLLLIDQGPRTFGNWTSTLDPGFAYPIKSEANPTLTSQRTVVGAIHSDEIFIAGIANQADFGGDVEKITVSLVYNRFNTALGTDHTLFTVDVPLDQDASGDTVTATINAHTAIGVDTGSVPVTYTVERTLDGGGLLSFADWNITVPTSMLPETLGPDVATMVLATTNNFGVARVGVTLLGTSGFTTSTSKQLGVDRDSRGVVELAEIRQTIGTAAGNFQPQVASDLSPDPNGDGAYVLSGNNLLRFRILDEDGVDLGVSASKEGSQKFQGLDVATGIKGPDFEWRLFGASDDSPAKTPQTTVGGGVVCQQTDPIGSGPAVACLDGVEAGSEGVAVKMALVLPCPQANLRCSNPAGVGAAKDEDPNVLTSGELRLIFFPIQIGYDPLIAVVCATDPWDPTTYTPCPADVQSDANGNSVPDAFEGAGFGLDLVQGTAVLQRSICGTVLGTQGLPGANLNPQNVQNCPPGTTLPQTVSTTQAGSIQFSMGPDGTSPWVGESHSMITGSGAGVDEGYVAACRASADDCVYDPYSPYGADPNDAAGYAETCREDPPSTDTEDIFIGSCFFLPVQPNDAWAECMRWNIGTLDLGSIDSTRAKECDFLERYADETVEEIYYLVNRNTPIFFKGTAFNALIPPAILSGSVAPDYKAGPEDQPDYPNRQGPDSSPNQYHLFRGFDWARAAGTEMTVVDAEGGLVDFTFDDLQSALDLRPTLAGGAINLDYGKILVPDGTYTVTFRTIDQTSCYSSLEKSGVANNGCIPSSHDFKLLLQNDKDKDGTSDIREAWLNAALRNGTMKNAIVPGGAFYADRYQDLTTLFPLHGAASTDNTASDNEDWDGDGIPNSVKRQLPTGQIIDIDVELMLNTDPLEPDAVVEPFSPLECLAGGASGKGVLGDRNGNCIPNGAATIGIEDKQIHRDAEPQGGEFPSEETQAFIRELLEVAPATICVQDALGATCDHLVQVNLDGSPQGISHLYIDAVPNGAETTFSVGAHMADGTHAEIIGTATLPEAVETVFDTIDLLQGEVDAALCIRGVTGPDCPHFITVSPKDSPQGVLHVYADATPDGLDSTFSVGIHGTESGEQELVGSDTLAGAIDELQAVLEVITGELEAVLCVQGEVGDCEDHLVKVILDPPVQGIEHLYVDATPDGAETTFSIGTHTTAGGDQELVGTDTFADAVDEVQAIVDLLEGAAEDTLCIRGVFSDCTDHLIKVTFDPPVGGVEHAYVDATPAGAATTFSVGIHLEDGGDEEIVGSNTLNGAIGVVLGVVGIVQAAVNQGLATARDLDGDGVNNDLEIQSGSNPFHWYSRPNNKGVAGFPRDWDADNSNNDLELQARSDPFRQCSTPSNPGSGITGGPTHWPNLGRTC